MKVAGWLVAKLIGHGVRMPQICCQRRVVAVVTRLSPRVLATVFSRGVIQAVGIE